MGRHTTEWKKKEEENRCKVYYRSFAPRLILIIYLGKVMTLEVKNRKLVFCKKISFSSTCLIFFTTNFNLIAPFFSLSLFYFPILALSHSQMKKKQQQQKLKVALFFAINFFVWKVFLFFLKLKTQKERETSLCVCVLL